MPWKLAEDGKSIAVGESGNPIFTNEGQDPVEVDWTSALGTIGKLNNENQERRTAGEVLTGENQALKNSLAAYEGIDIDSAKKAIETMNSIDQKELLKADEVESFKKSILTAAEAERKTQVDALKLKLNEVTEIALEKENSLNSMIVNNAFHGSKFVNDLLSPMDMKIAKFSPNFKVEDGALVGYAKDGNKIMSRQDPSVIADFDESIKILVNDYPDKNLILPGLQGGSGSQGGGGNNSAGFLNPEQINALSINEYEAAKKDGRIKQYRTR